MEELYVVLDKFNEYMCFSNIEDAERYVEIMGGKDEIFGIFKLSDNLLDQTK